MNKYVDRLLDASKEILTHLAIDVQERDEAWIHELHTHQEFFEQYYKIYTTETTAYIDIDAISDRTKSSENGNLWQRMTQAVAIANLANLLLQVDDLDNDHEKIMPVLQRIDDNFPVSFIPGGRDGLQSQNWLVDNATVEQAFAVRAQRFIETLRNFGAEAHPLRSLLMVFYDIECNDDALLNEYLDTAQYRPFDGFDINAVEAKQYQDRVHGFRNLLEQMQPDEVVAQLRGNESEYNLGSFLAGFKDWIRASEAKVPGPSQPLAHLAYNGDSPSSAGAQLQAEANTSRFTASGIMALKQRLNSGHPATQQRHEDFPSMDERAPYNYDSQSMAGTVLEVYNMGQDMLASQNDGSMYAVAAAQAASQNLGGGAGRKRNRKSTGDGNSQAKRMRELAAMPPPSSFPAPDPNALAGSPSVDFDPLALSQAAQLITKANKKQSMPKARRPWSVHDTQQLVRAIHVYKAKWSTIQKAIENHHVQFNVIDRDQQALRDKARLVKVDILKCVPFTI